MIRGCLFLPGTGAQIVVNYNIDIFEGGKR